MTNTQLAIQLGGVAMGGVIVGGAVGGALVGAYKAIDADKHLPRWADMLGVACAYGLAVIAAALGGAYVSPELSELGKRTCEIVAGLGAVAGPGLWPSLQARLMGYIQNTPAPAAPPAEGGE